jgi:hypothetical protein
MSGAGTSVPDSALDVLRALYQHCENTIAYGLPAAIAARVDTVLSHEKSANDALNQRVACNVQGRVDAFMRAAHAAQDGLARHELRELLKFFPLPQLPDLESPCRSWILTRLDGKVFESFFRDSAVAALELGWRVETAAQYLRRNNREVRFDRPVVES